jgi:hypothetical protein
MTYDGMAFRINGAYLQLFQMNRNAPVGKCVATEIAREIGWQEVGEESL